LREKTATIWEGKKIKQFMPFILYSLVFAAQVVTSLNSINLLFPIHAQLQIETMPLNVLAQKHFNYANSSFSSPHTFSISAFERGVGEIYSENV
jgi:hypothetical protein